MEVLDKGAANSQKGQSTGARQRRTNLGGGDGEESFGKLLQKYAPNFQMYNDFFQKLQPSIDAFTHFEESSPAFVELLKQLKCECPRSVGMLEIKQIMPPNRLAQYAMTLVEIIKRTLPAEQEDLNQVKEILVSLNEKKREKEESERQFKIINELAKRLSIHDLCSDPARKFIAEGDIYKTTRKSEKAQRKLFLFNNMIVVRKSKENSAIIYLNSDLCVQVTPLGNELFRLNSTGKVFEFIDSPVNVNKRNTSWCKLIDRTINEFRAKSRRFSRDVCSRAAAGSRAPVWEKDNTRDSCSNCDAKFSRVLGHGKHHCRNCGKIFCDNCSKFRKALEFRNDDDEVRVCEKCFHKVSAAAAAAAAATAPSDDGINAAIVGSGRDARCFSQDSSISNLSLYTTEPSSQPQPQQHGSQEYDDYIMTHMFDVRIGDSAAWTERFVRVSSSFALHIFVSLDQPPYYELPLAGAKLKNVTVDIESNRMMFAIVFYVPAYKEHKNFWFRTRKRPGFGEEDVDEWHDACRNLINAELPPDHIKNTYRGEGRGSGGGGTD